jgi:Tfp pilus assembly protein PilV
MKNLNYRRCQSARGMVLIEVVTALVIFTVVAFSMVMALNAAMDVALERNDIDAATRGLENEMNILRGSRVVAVDQDLPDDGSGILYHVTVRAESLQDQQNKPVANTYRATITAKWKLNGTPEDRSISFLLYQP